MIKYIKNYKVIFKCGYQGIIIIKEILGHEGKIFWKVG